MKNHLHLHPALLAIPLVSGPLAGATIDFESPAYTAGNIASATNGATTNCPFDGQDGWSRSASGGIGAIVNAAASGEFGGGQVLGGGGSTYIGGKNGHALFQGGDTAVIDVASPGSNIEVHVGCWDDTDGDGLFDQAEAQAQFGIVAFAGGARFGIRAAGYGTRIDSGVATTANHWYRCVVTAGEPDETGSRTITMRVRNLTTATEVDFDPATAGSQPWVRVLSAAEFGAAPADCEGTTARVNQGGFIDHISGTEPALPTNEFHWDGEGVDGNWSTAANWVDDALPAAGGNLIFDGGLQTFATQNLGSGFNVPNLLFPSSAGAFTLDGQAIATGGLIQNDSFNPQVFTLPVQLTGDLGVIAAGTVYFDGALSGSGGLVKSGTGGVQLTGANSFGGKIQVNAGTLDLLNDQSGATGGFEVLNTGATLGVAFEAQASVAAGKEIKLGVATSANFGTATLNLDGTLANAGSLALLRGSSLHVNGTANQSGDVLIEGVGGYGANLNVYAGGTFTHSGATPVVLRSGTNDAGRGRVTVNGGTFVTGQPFDYDSPSTFTGRLTLAGGGTLQLSAPVATLATDIEVVLGAGGGTFDTGAHATAIAVPVSGTGSLTKSGGGTLTLGAAPAYSGDTFVEEGTLALAAPGLPDAAAVDVAASGATLQLDFPAGSPDTVMAFRIDGEDQAPGTWGSLASTAVHKTALITGTGLLVVPSADPFADWIDSFVSLTDPADKEAAADPDHDGLTNLEEFALDGDPASAAGDGKVRAEIADLSGTRYLTLTLPVRAGAVFNGPGDLISDPVDGVIYGIQGSPDLGDFTAPDVVALPAPLPGTRPSLTGADWEYRSFRLGTAVTEAARGFLRATVTDAP